MNLKKKCGFTSNHALYLKMLVLVTAFNVPNFIPVSKSAQFAWNFELCRRTNRGFQSLFAANLWRETEKAHFRRVKKHFLIFFFCQNNI